MERPSGGLVGEAGELGGVGELVDADPGGGLELGGLAVAEVMVPVLSSSRVLTSPAASTARPDIASTLRCTRRSIPAMPIAESSAPMVVGIRATTRATRTIRVCGAPAKPAIGCRAETVTRKTMVSEASRMLRAISLGVFCRAAPSTRAIIRSMKDLPGSEAILTTIRSESTLVPPVTALRSPPDSRMTGADSPVMADSSTEATPSTTSPSPGMISPASATHVVAEPAARWPRPAPPACEAGQSSRRRAIVSVLVRRSVSAWALPRPSATASARLAKIVVSQSQTVIAQAKTLGSAIAETVVTTEPTSTTNMTGFLIMTRGSSFFTASGTAARRTLGVEQVAGDPVDRRLPAGQGW